MTLRRASCVPPTFFLAPRAVSSEVSLRRAGRSKLAESRLAESKTAGIFRRAGLRALAVSLLVIVILGAALPSLATTYTVTSTADSGTGSLRAALGMAANGDTINFSLTYPATITLASQLLITTNVAISGPGAANLAISGGNTTNVLQVNPSVTGLGATISGVTIRNGALNFLGFSGGAAIFNESGTLTVSNSTFIGNSNTSSQGGGAIDNGFGSMMTVSNCTFSGNSASEGGAIDNHATLTVSDSTFSGNNFASAAGGAIYNEVGTLTVSNSTFSGNSTYFYGGAILNFGTVTVGNSTFSRQLR